MSAPAALGVLLCLAVALVASGCGGDTVASFREHGLRPLEQRVDVQRARLAALLRGARPGSKASARELLVESAPLVRTARTLARLSAPPAVARATRAFAAATAGLARELRGLARAIARGGSVAIRHASAAVRTAVGALQQARITLDEAAAR